MELSTVVFLSLVLCGMVDVHAGDSLESLTIRVEVVEQDLSLWKYSNTKSVTKLTKKFKVWKESLKEELTSTILPSLIKPLVEKEITNILTEDDIGHRITGQVRDEVHSLKDNMQYIKTRLRAITRDLRHVERESDTYRKSVRKERSELTKDIRALQMQVNQTVVRATSRARMLTSRLNQIIGDLLETNQTLTGLTQDFRTLNTSFVVTEREIKSYREGLQEMKRNVSSDIQSLNIQLNQTISDQFHTNQTLAGLTQDFTTLNTSCCGMRKEIKEPSTTTYPGTTEASTDPSRNNTSPPTPVTTQDLQASTTDASENLTPSTTVPPSPGTTQDSDTHATPSPAAGRDLYYASSRGDLETVKRILAEGHVDINYRGDYSKTPVMMAAQIGHRDVVEFLMGRGADMSLVDRGGNNVLYFACAGGDLETVKLILSMNVVDINVRNNYGYTAADWARGRRHQRVLDLLVSRGAH
ncbi:ankyrin repeat and SOCS box protein 2-like [Haliotis asinina]|uniref:ankyrin repeat and SOCS box protein 2-like n=1 Tax=Haliotis asinina TaxID=109174 RepID=UPI003531F8DE